MRHSTTWTIVGGLWGMGIGLVFGSLPAFALINGVMADWISSNDDDQRMWFALLWGACCLFLVILGTATGHLLGRQPPRGE